MPFCYDRLSLWGMMNENSYEGKNVARTKFYFYLCIYLLFVYIFKGDLQTHIEENESYHLQVAMEYNVNIQRNLFQCQQKNQHLRLNIDDDQKLISKLQDKCRGIEEELRSTKETVQSNEKKVNSIIR